eukprot:3572109-Prymnesium_polylepis.1
MWTHPAIVFCQLLFNCNHIIQERRPQCAADSSVSDGGLSYCDLRALNVVGRADQRSVSDKCQVARAQCQPPRRSAELAPYLRAGPDSGWA